MQIIVLLSYTISQVASRNVIITSGLIMLILGVVVKFGAFFASIPGPVLGGLFMVVFGM